jgi:hypothetical protein
MKPTNGDKNNDKKKESRAFDAELAVMKLIQDKFFYPESEEDKIKKLINLKKSEAFNKSIKELNLPEGKCPVDNRKNRHVFIITNNKRTVVVVDGKGHAYKAYGEGYDIFSSVCKVENIINPKDYEFDRGMTGMDF